MKVFHSAPVRNSLSATTGDGFSVKFATSCALAPSCGPATIHPYSTSGPVGSTPIDNANAKEMIVTAPQFAAVPMQTDAFRWQWKINYPVNKAGCEIYAVDLCVTEMDTPGGQSL